MPENGNYLLTTTGFDAARNPFLVLQQNNSFASFSPLEQTLSLSFDTSQRFCTGWRDMEASERHPCPEQKAIDSKYETCPACQQRTGFNPAFYNAATVSEQQEKRNQLPHALYLAYFGGNVVKIGITLGSRVTSRLLEQGARSAIVLEEFASANIARQHEATIARLDGIFETISVQRKLKLFEAPYSNAEAERILTETRVHIMNETKTSYDGEVVQHFDAHYFPNETPNLATLHTVANVISGKVIGMIGSVLLCQNDSRLVALPLKQYTGYRCTLGSSATDLDLPAEQLSLL